MKQICLYLVVIFSSVASTGSVEQELAIIETSFNCPESVELSSYLDGGTISVSVANKVGEKYSFCLDGRLIAFKPSKPLTNEEKKILRRGRELKIYLGVDYPIKDGALAIEFKGPEEFRLRSVLLHWIDCNPKGSQMLKVFLESMDGERLQKVGK